MRSIETEGDSIDDAIANALRALEVERDRVEIEILADVSRGLFGFGGKRARVRATVRRPLSAAVEQTIDDQQPVSRETGSAPPSLGATERPARPSHRTGSPAAASSSLSVVRPVTSVTPETAERAAAVLTKLVGLIGIASTVTPRIISDGSAVLDVAGDSGGLLIGRRGQTLDALEYMVNRIMARGEDGTGRFVVDVERYRERRREYLESLAKRLADKARHTGRPVTLNPMSPRDRRIVHLALQSDATVSTRSQGDGYFRRVLLVPADRGQRRGRQGAGPS